MRISVFTSAREKTPLSQDLTWPELAARLSRFRLRADIPRRIAADLALLDRLAADPSIPGWMGDRFRERLARCADPARVAAELATQVPRWRKTGLLAWSPTAYLPDATRCTEHVVDVGALVLDIDGGEPLDRVWSLWSAHPRLLHTSWSHTADHPKVRLVVPLAEPVPATGWLRVWTHARIYAARRDVRIDEKCSNPDRLYFAPALPSADAPREVRTELAGELLHLRWQELVDPDAARRAARTARRPPPPRRPSAWVDHHDPDVRERVAENLSARVLGAGSLRRADRISCPSCSRPSVYFYVQPSRSGWARCDHKVSCGWAGPLDALSAVAA